MKYYIFLIFICFFLETSSSAQTVRFDKCYTLGSYCNGLAVTNDNNFYIIAGYQNNEPSFIDTTLNSFVMKVDLHGDTFFTKKYGYSGFGFFNDICKTNDSSFICVGVFQSIVPDNEYDYDLYVVKINSNGDTIWTKRYSCPGDSTYAAYSVIESQNKNIFIAGYQYAWTDDNFCSLIIKLDSFGNLIWRKCYKSTNPYPYNLNFIMNWVSEIRETNDNCIIAAGGKGEYINGNPSIFKVDSTGNILWSKTYYGSSELDCCNSIEKTLDNNYIISISYQDIEQPHRICFLKVDLFGNKIWQKKYSYFYSGGFTKAIPTSDGGYVGCGISDYADNILPDMDGFLIKLDSNGDSLWMRYFGTNQQHDLFFDVKQTPDKGYIMTGETYSYNPGGSSLWLVKVDSLGLLFPVGINEEPLFPLATINAFPNPAVLQFTISTFVPEFSSNAEVLLFNMQGKQLANYPLQKGENNTEISMENYAAGTYLYVLAIDNYNVRSGKIIVAK